VEYRQPVGVDSYLTNYPGATDGVLIHIPGSTIGDAGTTADSTILALRPTADYPEMTPALSTGMAWTTPDGVTISTKAASSTGATVAVTFPCSASAPGVPHLHFAVPPSHLGTGSNPTIPAYADWTASSTTGATYELQESVNGGQWTGVSLSSSAALKSPSLSVYQGNSYDFQVRAKANGCNSGWTVMAPLTTDGFQETSPSYLGTWSRLAYANAWGGATKFTKAANASASLTFTGRNVAWITSMGTGHGSAQIFVDGTLVKTVSTYATANKDRQLLFRYGFPSSAQHTIKVVNLATSGHPRIDIDGFAVLR
jgi:hypothetical protein